MWICPHAHDQVNACGFNYECVSIYYKPKPIFDNCVYIVCKMRGSLKLHLICTVYTFIQIFFHTIQHPHVGSHLDSFLPPLLMLIDDHEVSKYQQLLMSDKTVTEHSSIIRGVETLSQLPDILTYFHHSCPAPHILSIQFSFNLPDIH